MAKNTADEVLDAFKKALGETESGLQRVGLFTKSWGDILQTLTSTVLSGKDAIEKLQEELQKLPKSLVAGAGALTGFTNGLKEIAAATSFVAKGFMSLLSTGLGIVDKIISGIV
ncbi:MAG: hypothetical protein Q7K43_05550, partial [Candidatus Woesearchaeota archaeon]|nr:hypothetical protein [Candidatus Woesearchaeota archaeon]